MAINDTMFARPPIYARRSDLIDLQSIATRACLASPGLPLLREELKRLTVVPDEATTRHVRLGSRAVYKDLANRRERIVRVVAPEVAASDPENQSVSIVSLIGAALLGLSPGAVFRWQEPGGTFRAIKVLDVLEATREAEGGGAESRAAEGSLF